jgi:hypothetical protein
MIIIGEAPPFGVGFHMATGRASHVQDFDVAPGVFFGSDRDFGKRGVRFTF